MGSRATSTCLYDDASIELICSQSKNNYFVPVFWWFVFKTGIMMMMTMIPYCLYCSILFSICHLHVDYAEIFFTFSFYVKSKSKTCNFKQTLAVQTFAYIMFYYLFILLNKYCQNIIWFSQLLHMKTSMFLKNTGWFRVIRTQQDSAMQSHAAMHMKTNKPKKRLFL